MKKSRSLLWLGIGAGFFPLAGGIYYLSSTGLHHALRWAGEKAGRKISLEGGIDIGWSREPEITLHHLRVANADWAHDPYFFEAERIELSVHPLEWLRGRFVIPHLRMVKPILSLEKKDKHTANWDWTQNPAETALSAPLPEHRWEFPIIGHMQIEAGEITYRDAQKNILTTVGVVTGQGQADAEELIHVTGKGRYEGKPFLLTMTGASVLQLRESTRPYPFMLKTRIGDTYAEMQGTAKDPLTLEGFDMKLDLKGRNAADLFPLTGIALPPSPPYHVRGHLVHEDKQWFFHDFSGTLGGSDLRGEIVWDLRRERPYFKGEFTSNHLDMKDLAPFIGADGKQVRDDRVIPDKSIDLSRLMAMDADATFRAKRIAAPEILDDFSMNAHLKEGVLTLKPLSFGLAQGKIDADVTIDGTRKPPVATGTVIFKRLSAQ